MYGVIQKVGECIDKVCLLFLRCILKVKKSTSKLMVYGELGVIPPSILANINNIIFHIRLKSLPKDDIVCQLYNDLLMLDDNGFDILKTSDCYNIDVSSCLFNARCVRCVEMAPQFFKYNL